MYHLPWESFYSKRFNYCNAEAPEGIKEESKYQFCKVSNTDYKNDQQFAASILAIFQLLSVKQTVPFHSQIPV